MQVNWVPGGTGISNPCMGWEMDVYINSKSIMRTIEIETFMTWGSVDAAWSQAVQDGEQSATYYYNEYMAFDHTFPDLNTTTLRDQFYCHYEFAYWKTSGVLDLESWRVPQGTVGEFFSGCNPGQSWSKDIQGL